MRNILCSVSIAALLLGGCKSEPKPKGDADHPEGGEHADEHATTDGHEEGIVELSAEAVARSAIRAVRVERRVLAGSLATTGRVDYDRNRVAQVGSRLEGRVSRILVELGQEVKAGQTLALIDSVELGKAKAEHLQAKSRLELAKENHERESKLHEQRISSGQEAMKARSDFKEAEAVYEAAHETLRILGLTPSEIEQTKWGDSGSTLLPLRAPFDGKVIAQEVTRGELVTPEKNLFTIGDLKTVWVWIDLYERDIAHVHIGDEVDVRLDAYPERSFSGKVSYLKDEVDPASRTILGRVEVPNPDGLLRPNMFARILLSDPHASGGAEAIRSLVIPDSALQRNGEKQIVFVQTGERRFQRTEVTTGRSAEGFVEVLTGLRGDEKVVVEGSFLLKSEDSKGEMGGGHSH